MKDLHTEVLPRLATELHGWKRTRVPSPEWISQSGWYKGLNDLLSPNGYDETIRLMKAGGYRVSIEDEGNEYCVSFDHHGYEVTHGEAVYAATLGEAISRAADAALTSSSTNNRAAVGDGRAGMNRKRIFSGDYSSDMWREINSARNVEHIRLALYTVCCRLQELEAELFQQRKLKKPRKRK